MKPRFSTVIGLLALAVAWVGGPVRAHAQGAPASSAGEAITVYNAQHTSLTKAWADVGIKSTGSGGNTTGPGKPEGDL